MGAWGYGYKENDTYYNDKPEYVQPLFESLEEALQDARKGGVYRDVYYTVSGSLRSRFMWLYNLLKDADVDLMPEHLETMRQTVELIREAANDEDSANTWSDPAEWKGTVLAELGEVELWMDKFKPQGPLAQRLPAIIEAMGKES